MLSPEPKIILDLSRLLSRILHATPTGVDRCEMAYARGLLATVPDRLAFAAVHPCGKYGRLNHDAVLRFLDATEMRWDHRGFTTKWDKRVFAIQMLIALRPRRSRINYQDPPPFYLQASPNNLTRLPLVANILERERARFVCLVHDLIPLQYPEYAREGGETQHRLRIQTLLSLADGLICNSLATQNSLQAWKRVDKRRPISVVAHLGTDFHLPTPQKSQAVEDRPYFVCIGTIEPRKNHLLLLNIWRRLSEQHGPYQIPKLIIIGRRGWENEQIVDMLDRCPALRGCVEERGRLTDREVANLLTGARALLMPSFAEGYGMPVSEALAANVPILCSDLPSLREAGGEVPEFLDPLDGPAWLHAIKDLAAPASRIRSEQKHRRTMHAIPTWPEHIAIVLDLLHRLGR